MSNPPMNSESDLTIKELAKFKFKSRATALTLSGEGKKSEEEPCSWASKWGVKERSRNENDRLWRAKVYYKSKSDSWLSWLIEYHRPPARTVSFPQTKFLTFQNCRKHKLIQRQQNFSALRKIHKIELILTFELLCEHDVDVRSSMWMCVLVVWFQSNRSKQQRNQLTISDLGQRPKKSSHSHVSFGELLIVEGD